MIKMSPREAVCQFMGWEFGEALDYRYHYGRTSAPIYSTPGGYVCATAQGKKPPKYSGLVWVEAQGATADYCRSRGKIVWVASGTIED